MKPASGLEAQKKETRGKRGCVVEQWDYKAEKLEHS